MKTRTTVLVAITVLLLPLSALSQPSFSGSETRITTDLGDQYDPAISGDLIVFTDYRGLDTDIWYYDLATGAEVQVTSGAGNQELTDVSAGRIAYTDYLSADVVVYTVADATSRNLTAQANSISINPAIGGPIVAWEDRRDGNPEIYAADLASGEERRITNSPTVSDLKPAVGGGVVVWQACSGTSCDVLAYDWASGTTRAIAATAADERRPDVQAGAVVFDSLSDGDRDVFYFDLATAELKRLALPSEQINPNISGDFVAFEDLADAGYHIKLWHVPSGAVFDVSSGSPGYQFLNDIDGNRIVYTDDRNGQLDIYLYAFTYTPPPPAVVDCAHLGDAEPLLDQRFVRTLGAPAVVSVPFSAPAGEGLFCIDNGVDGAPYVTAATLALNGAALLGPGDLKDENGELLPSIELRAGLEASNVLAARMLGRPGSAMRVRVFAVAPQAAASAMPRMLSAAPALASEPVASGASGSEAGAALLDDAEPQSAYGCSQAGNVGLASLLALLALLALLPRPALARVRSRR